MQRRILWTGTYHRHGPLHSVCCLLDCLRYLAGHLACLSHRGAVHDTTVLRGLSHAQCFFLKGATLHKNPACIRGGMAELGRACDSQYLEAKNALQTYQGSRVHYLSSTTTPVLCLPSLPVKIYVARKVLLSGNMYACNEGWLALDKSPVTKQSVKGWNKR